MTYDRAGGLKTVSRSKPTINGHHLSGPSLATARAHTQVGAQKKPPGYVEPCEASGRAGGFSK